MFKKLISIIMAAIMTTAFIGSTISAAEIAPSYSSAITYDSNLSISPSGTATCISIFTGNSNVTQIKIIQRLYKKNPDGTWTLIAVWETVINGNSAILTNTRLNLPPGTYRLETEFSVCANNVWEKIITLSKEVTI